MCKILNLDEILEGHQSVVILGDSFPITMIDDDKRPGLPLPPPSGGSTACEFATNVKFIDMWCPFTLHFPQCY